MKNIAEADYWESRFENEGAMWAFEPSDSAISALGYFLSKGVKSILIPGFGYGRNGKIFLDNGFDITGIEISRSAIEIARSNGIDCIIHHGSVTEMPFDNKRYDSVFCYALIHLLNKKERHRFLEACHSQLNANGLMIFTAASKKSELFGAGKQISNDRFELAKGLTAFFYDEASVISEFSEFGLVESKEIEEPVKFMTGQEPVKLIYVVCRKSHLAHYFFETGSTDGFT